MSSSAKTAAASATARCASSTSLPQTQAPRWGSGGLCVLRSAARELRHRQGRAECSSYVLVNKYSPNGGQRGRSCHGSLPRWSPYAALPPPELAHGQRVRSCYPPPRFPSPLFPPQTTAARDPALDLLSAPVSFATGGASPLTALNFPPFMAAPFELELWCALTIAEKKMTMVL